MTFQKFSNFWPIFFSTGAFLSSSVDPPFKESTDHGLSIIVILFQFIASSVGTGFLMQLPVTFYGEDQMVLNPVVSHFNILSFSPILVQQYGINYDPL